MRDEPVAVDLPKAGRPPKPEIGPVAVLQRAAHPIEAVPKCHVIAQGEREVANLVTERTLVHRKSVRPVFLFCLCSHVPQRRYDVERHDVSSRSMGAAPPPHLLLAVRCWLRQSHVVVTWIPASVVVPFPLELVDPFPQCLSNAETEEGFRM